MATVLVSLPTRRPRSHGIKTVDAITLTQPAFSAWRSNPISTTFEYKDNGKLYGFRYHPHAECTGRFMLLPEQVTALLKGWSDTPSLAVVLPQLGKTRCEARRLPDGGMELVRLDRRGKRAITFRLFVADVPLFLAFCRRPVLAA